MKVLSELGRGSYCIFPRCSIRPRSVRNIPDQRELHFFWLQAEVLQIEEGLLGMTDIIYLLQMLFVGNRISTYCFHLFVSRVGKENGI